MTTLFMGISVCSSAPRVSSPPTAAVILTSLSCASLGLKSHDTKVYYIMQMVSIMQYLRSRSYLHRDLKPANLLLNEKFQLVLSDFGTAVQINQPEELQLRKTKSHACLNQALCGVDYAEELVGTQEYISPEALARNQKLTFGNDLWSLGVIVWQMYSRENRTPFEAGTAEETSRNILNCDYKMPDGDDVTAEVRDLIARLLVPDAEKRLGADCFSKLMAHQLFCGRSFDSLYESEPHLPTRLRKLTK